MTSVERSLAYARKHFPEGPEKLAEHLKVEVRYSALSGCDGWYLTFSTGSLTSSVNFRAALVRSSRVCKECLCTRPSRYSGSGIGRASPGFREDDLRPHRASPISQERKL